MAANLHMAAELQRSLGLHTFANGCAGIRGALEREGPVLTRVAVDYRRRPIRWLQAARQRYMRDLTPQQKARFLARAGSRALDRSPDSSS